MHGLRDIQYLKVYHLGDKRSFILNIYNIYVSVDRCCICLTYMQALFNPSIKNDRNIILYVFMNSCIVSSFQFPCIHFNLSVTNDNETLFNLYCLYFLLSLYCLLPCHESVSILYDTLVYVFSKFNIWFIIWYEMVHGQNMCILNRKADHVVYNLTQFLMKIMYKIFSRRFPYNSHEAESYFCQVALHA